MMLSNSKYRSWIPHGFDFVDADQTAFIQGTNNTIRKILSEAGYREIILPTLDYSPTFSITSRDAVQRSRFETRDSDGDVLAIRSDLTVQVVKAAATGRLGDDFPLKVSYFQKVFHDIPWGSGKRREIFQAGVELVGDEPGDRFAGILALARRVFAELNLSPRIIYGDARFLDLLFALAPPEHLEEISHSFHIKDTAAIRAIGRKANFDKNLATLLEHIPITFGGKEALAELRQLCNPYPSLLSLLDYADKHDDLIYDFSLIREQSYYTGPVFEGYIPSSRHRVLTGGIYDTLYKNFSSEKRPAAGFAINVDILTGLY